MDPVNNPYAPGAGTPPPELAGREDLRESSRIALQRIRAGRSAKSLMLIGLRGVGKTVLLDKLRQDAEELKLVTLRVEAPERRSLPAMLAPQLRVALLRLSRDARMKSRAERALRALAGFASVLKVKFQDIEVGLDFAPERGLADNGDLESDLQALLQAAGEAAKDGGSALVMFIDELQYVAEDQLSSLITALHSISQLQLPVALVGAGLPQLPGLMGRAKSYAERLFEFKEIGPLPDDAARLAISKPASDQNVEFSAPALDRILKETQGYPYFLQEWGKHTWDAASHSPIQVKDVDRATKSAVAALDESFFRVRFDRLKPSERKYLRAMSELGAGPYRSGDIASELARGVQGLAPTRASLIAKGMIWSPGHGDNEFTVPLFDRFMKRIMPGEDWRN